MPFQTLRRALLTLLLWCGLWSSGCQGGEGQATEVLVVVDAHEALRTELTRVELEGERGRADVWLADPPSGKKRQSFPFSISLAPKYEGQEIATLELRGYAGEQLLIERVARIRFVRGERRMLHLFLHERCSVGQTSCGAGHACDDCGQCAPPEVLETEPRSRDPLAGGVLECGSPDGGPPGVGEGGSEQDGDSGDAGELGGDGAVSAPLALTGPALAATGSCQALSVTRGDGLGAALPFTIEGLGSGELFADPSCSEAAGELGFAAQDESLTVYYRPALPTGERVAELTLRARAAEQLSPPLSLEVRRRAVEVVAGARFSLVRLDDGSVFSMGTSETSNLGFQPPADALHYATPQAAPLFAALGLADIRNEHVTSCGLVDGDLYCWGGGDYGQLGRGDYVYLSATPLEVSTFPGAAAGHPVTHFDVGHKMVCAIKAGVVFCWGFNEQHQVSSSSDVSVPSATKIVGLEANHVQVAAGWAFGCALDVDGVVRCWGNGSATPTVVSLPGGRKAKQIAGCGGAVCALDVQGAVYCWGDNYAGQLGHAGETSALPGKVSLPEPVDEVVVGGAAVCARSESALYCWGAGDDDRLGTGQVQRKAPPARVLGLPEGSVEAVAVGSDASDHQLAIVDGLVYGWGFHAHGQLGTTVLVGDFLEPTETSLLGVREPDAVRVYGWGSMLRTSVSCALTDGALECWGAGVDGELGNGAAFTDSGSHRIEPGLVEGLGSQVTDVEVGSGYVMAIKDGRVYGWGNDYDGSGTENAFTPVLIPGLPTTGEATRVEAGDRAACAIFTGGSAPGLYCWGADPAARAAAGITEPGTVAPPVLVLEGAVTAVTLASRGGCAVRSGGVWCWGDFAASDAPVLMDGLPEVSSGPAVTQVALGREKGCALTDQGTLHCFNGTGPADQLGQGFTAIRAGEFHFCASKDDDKGLYCWGENYAGQLGTGDRARRQNPSAVPGIVPPVSAFDAGGREAGVTCARDAEAFKCWGNNASRPMGLVPFVTQPTLLLPWP